MWQYPNIDPVILEIYGPFAIRWYGLMYVIGFALTYWVMRYRAKVGALRLTVNQIHDVIFWGILGVLVGGRLGYILFYNFEYHLNNPLQVFAVWQGGMSYHGGLVLTATLIWLYAIRNKLSMLEIADVAVIGGSIGLFFSRIGNFINGELYGRVTESPIGMVFPEGGPLPRHPSQLYESLGEGLLCFVVLWLIKDRVRKGQILFVYLLMYGAVRFVIEFFREPTVHTSLFFGWMTMGQLLCIFMILVGLLGLYILGFRVRTPKVSDQLIKA